MSIFNNCCLQNLLRALLYTLAHMVFFLGVWPSSNIALPQHTTNNIQIRSINNKPQIHDYSTEYYQFRNIRVILNYHF